MRFKRVAGAITAASIFSATVLTGSAQAVTACSGSLHCYGEDHLEGNGSYPNAAGTDLRVDCLSVANRSTQFADWEMWFSTNTPQVSYDTWVEEGMTSGTLQGGYVGFMWFWADQRPNGTYNEHYIRNATTGTTTNVAVYYAGSNNQNVYLGGSYVGYSSGNGSGGLYADAGAEVTTTATTVSGSSNNFQYRNSSGWHWATPSVYDNSGGLWSITTSGSYLWVNTGCGASAAASALRPKPSPVPSNTEQAQKMLTRIGRYVASLTHESSPSRIRMTRSSRQRALSVLSGDKVNSNQAVDVIELKGRFSSFRRAAQHKMGHLPTGDTLTVLVDAATGQITDWQISNIGASAMAKLGTVTALS